MFSAGIEWKKKDERKMKREKCHKNALFLSMPAQNNVRYLHVARESFHLSLETIQCLPRDLLKGRSEAFLDMGIT